MRFFQRIWSHNMPPCQFSSSWLFTYYSRTISYCFFPFGIGLSSGSFAIHRQSIQFWTMQVKPCYKWLLTSALLALGHGVALKYRDLASETCATLRNHETHSSVEVSVGNPPQSFSLIADTGSDAVIVKDCACGNCRPEWGRTCFSGPQHSSSFNVTFFEAPNVQRSQKKKHAAHLAN